ncbi:MAG: aldo/keto reductase [Candidatus Dormibacteraeota bacterium]|nr:aldo/keto reductase [Candidatus Dormibacteraeota bacterium]
MLGRSGLAVTPVGLGLAALGRPAYINLGRDADLGARRSVADLRLRTHAVLDAAYDAGLRYVDVARSYGLAEAFLASWLEGRGLAPGEIVVGSKWGYTYTGEWRLDAESNEVKDHSSVTFRRQYRESREILGDSLRLYQVHSATLESGVLDDQALLSELARLRSDGLAVGFTASGPRQSDVIRRAIALEVDGVKPFDTVQATWNLLEPSAGPALAEAHGAGFGVIVKEALANGRLTEHAAGAPTGLRELAGRTGASLDAVALAAALANPWVDVVLSGAVTVEQLESNLGAMNTPLIPAVVRPLLSFAEPADQYWEERKRLPWS